MYEVNPSGERIHHATIGHYFTIVTTKLIFAVYHFDAILYLIIFDALLHLRIVIFNFINEN